MKKSIKENLDFQKNNFPNIYNSYLNATLSEVALTAENIDIEYTQKEYIQIVTNEPNDVVFKLFKIPIYEFIDINLNDYKEIHLIKDVNTCIEGYGNILEIKHCYPYILNAKKVIISKTVKKDDVENRIDIFVLKKLTIFEKRYLKSCLHRVTQMNDIDELEQYLINYKAKYKFSEILDRVENYNKSKIKSMNQDYKDMVIGELIKIAIESDGKNNNIIVDKLIKYINTKHKDELLNVLSYFMTDRFVTNFKLVEIYMMSKNTWINSINKNYKNGLQVYINSISAKKKSEKIALLLDGKLNELEKLFVNSINNFILDLRKVGDE